jgi:hypothetical protein
MKTISLFLLISLLILSGRTFCQEQSASTNNMHFNNSLGVAAGWSMGYGLSYRYQPKRLGAEITFFPYKDPRTTQYTGGLTFLCKLVENNDKTLNLFLYESNAYYFIKNVESTYFLNHGKEGPFHTYDVRSFSNNGAGVGVEVFVLNWFVFDIMGGYSFYNSFKEYRFTGETALLFKF